MFLVGIICFIYEVNYQIKTKNITLLIKKYITPGIILYAVMLLFFLIHLKDQRFIHYDNFSHWGVIVKSLIMNKAVFNANESIITFNSYPPGSALFIFYFSNLVGVSESLALYSQIIVILSALLPLFSFSSFEILDKSLVINRKMKGIIFLLTTLISLMLLNGPLTLTIY